MKVIDLSDWTLKKFGWSSVRWSAPPRDISVVGDERCTQPGLIPTCIFVHGAWRKKSIKVLLIAIRRNPHLLVSKLVKGAIGR